MDGCMFVRSYSSDWRPCALAFTLSPRLPGMKTMMIVLSTESENKFFVFAIIAVFATEQKVGTAYKCEAGNASYPSSLVFAA